MQYVHINGRNLGFITGKPFLSDSQGYQALYQSKHKNTVKEHYWQVSLLYIHMQRRESMNLIEERMYAVLL